MINSDNVISLLAWKSPLGRTPAKTRIDSSASQEALASDTSQQELSTGQLSLPFAATHTLLLVMASDFPAPNVFSSFAEGMRITIILDLRPAPRLDFIAPSRQQAFRFFETRGVSYRDIVSRVRALDIPDAEDFYHELWKSLVASLESFEITSSPALVIFDRPDFLSRATDALRSIFDVERIKAQQIAEIAAEQELQRM